MSDVAEAPANLPITRANLREPGLDGASPPDAPDWIRRYDHPYLHGVFAPTCIEYEAEALDVEGEIPGDLYGAYILNGPSQRFFPANRYHYYDGDAMLRAIYFAGGRASFRQRWIRNEAFVVEDIAGKAIWPGIAGPYDFRLPGSPIKDTSNTDVILYAGKLLSLWYMAGAPYDIDPLTLHTRGKEGLGGALRHTLSAHSKVDPSTGELFFFSYGDEAPYMRFGSADASGRLMQDAPVDLPGPRSPHDFGLTENYAILHDLPFFHDVEVLKAHGRRVMGFHPELPARFGIIRRRGAPESIRWFEAAPCYILHVVNCWEDGDWVHQVGCRQADPGYRRDPKDGPLASMLAQRRRVHCLHQWSFNLATGEVRERQLDDRNTEFPRINGAFAGRPNRYAFNQILPMPVRGEIAGQCQTFDGLIRYDLKNGETQTWLYGEGVYGNEAPIAPRRGSRGRADERDAFAVTFVTDTRDWTSSCLIFDAGDITQGPICSVKIPRRISAGFHAAWAPGEQIWG